MHTTENANVRDVLLRMGIGDFNATMCIPIMFMGPAQTDPDLTPVKLVTKAMQRIMQSMGAQIGAWGRIDQQTADNLSALAGPHWSENPWFELCTRLLDAQKSGLRFHPVLSSDNPVELSGMGLLPELADVPGGLVTVALGLGAAYYFFKHQPRRTKKRRR